MEMSFPLFNLLCVAKAADFSLFYSALTHAEAASALFAQCLPSWYVRVELRIRFRFFLPSPDPQYKLGSGSDLCPVKDVI